MQCTISITNVETKLRFAKPKASTEASNTCDIDALLPQSFSSTQIIGEFVSSNFVWIEIGWVVFFSIETIQNSKETEMERKKTEWKNGYK